MVLRNGLVALCEGAKRMDDAVYRLLRRELMNDPDVAQLVPPFVRTAQDTGAMWAFLKDLAPQWEPRRRFVREQFAPLIERLERGVPLADSVISDTLTGFNAEAVTAAWNKALTRREADPTGAITMARTLLETVCKHILEDEQGNASYAPHDDLPKLYRLVAKRLNLAPTQDTEEAVRRIFGGAISVVEGLATLRNRVSDAHAPNGRRPVKVAPRHAALAVNMAGTVALFLVETAQARSASPSAS